MKHMALVAWGVSNFGYSLTWLGITDTAMEGTFVYESNGQNITFNPPWQGYTKSIYLC